MISADKRTNESEATSPGVDIRVDERGSRIGPQFFRTSFERKSLNEPL